MRSLLTATLFTSLCLTACAGEPKTVVRTIDNRAAAYAEALELVDQARSETLRQPCMAPEEAYAGPVNLDHSIAQTDIALIAYACERDRAGANVSVFDQVREGLAAMLAAAREADP